MPPSAATPDPASSTGTATGLVFLLRGAWGRPEHRPALIGSACCLGLLGLAFWPTLRHFAYVWSTDENYSHGFLVPLIALYFANESAKQGPIAMRSGAVLGATLLVLAILGRLATIAVPIGIVGDLSSLLGIAGLCGLLFGGDALRRFAFSITFLVFMIPLPVALYTTIASPLQLMVSQAASVLLNASGIPVLCDGNLMTLPGGVRMFVAEACSGMRQLTGFLALTTAVAFMGPRPPWYRGALIASSIPIAMTANVTRVVLTGWIMYYDPRFASGAYHTLEGLLMMGFGLSLLSGECWVLNRIAARPRTTPSPVAAAA